MDVVHVPTSRVRDAAMFCLALIDKAASKGFETRQSLIDLAANGEADFWIAHDEGKPVGICFTQIRQTAKGRICDMLALGGGRLHSWWKDAMREVKDDARKHGATKLTCIRMAGRWTLFGLTPKGSYYEEEL